MASGCLSLFVKALINSPGATAFPILLNLGHEAHAREQQLYNLPPVKEIREITLYLCHVILDPGLEAFCHTRLPCVLLIALRTSSLP